jgi:hypothetical protein
MCWERSDPDIPFSRLNSHHYWGGGGIVYDIMKNQAILIPFTCSTTENLPILFFPRILVKPRE